MLSNVLAQSQHMYPIHSSYIARRLLGVTFIKTRRVLANGMGLDGYNKELGLALEYMCVQNYVENKEHFHNKAGSFEEQQKLNEEKLAQCKLQGIKLIRIHYRNNTFDKIKNELVLMFTNFGYKYATDINWAEAYEEFTNMFHSLYNDKRDKFLIDVLIVAETNGGECLETVYRSTKEGLRLRCANGHIFETTRDTLTRKRENGKGSWCNQCAHNAPKTDEQRSAIAKTINATYIDKVPLKGLEKWELEGCVKKRPTEKSINKSHVYLKLSCNKSGHITYQSEDSIDKKFDPNDPNKIYCKVCKVEDMKEKEIAAALKAKEKQKKKASKK